MLDAACDSDESACLPQNDRNLSAGARTLPTAYFVSLEVFAEEQSKLFARQWICVGHQSQIAKSGDYFVQDVAVESLIIVRDQSRRRCTDFTTSAATEGLGYAKRRVDTSPRFNVPITLGPMRLTANWPARRTWMKSPPSIRLITH